MKHFLLSAILLVTLLSAPATQALSNLPASTTTATAFIVNYDDDGTFLGYGTGFFVDEGTVVTNKHVIETGDFYRVYATGTDKRVNLDCYKKITRNDVKLNLDDDVAYMRAYVPCEHGIMEFGDDPEDGDDVAVVGFPYRGSLSVSMEIAVATGSVTGRNAAGWLRTSAHLDIGNSGGPVLRGTDVVGVAVAKGVDDDGNYITGYFIPSSVILSGLLYANDSRFGYIPRSRSSSSRSSSRSSSSRQSSVSSRSSQVSSRRSAVSSRRSSVRSVPAVPFSDVPRTRAGYEAIVSLYTRGIIGGYADGSFRPDAGINRAEFIKMLVHGFRADELNGEERCFSDVRNEWFAAPVCAAKRLGWIEGYPDGTFGPGRQISRAEAMKILITAFGQRAPSSVGRMPSDVRRGTWFYASVAAGVRLGIVNPQTAFRPERDLTREDSAIWIDAAAGE